MKYQRKDSNGIQALFKGTLTCSAEAVDVAVVVTHDAFIKLLLLELWLKHRPALRPRARPRDTGPGRRRDSTRPYFLGCSAQRAEPAAGSRTQTDYSQAVARAPMQSRRPGAANMRAVAPPPFSHTLKA